MTSGQHSTRPRGTPRERVRARAVVLASAFAALFVGHATIASAADKVVLQLGWIPTGEYAPYFAGKAEGF